MCAETIKIKQKKSEETDQNAEDVEKYAEKHPEESKDIKVEETQKQGGASSPAMPMVEVSLPTVSARTSSEGGHTFMKRSVESRGD